MDAGPVCHHAEPGSRPGLDDVRPGDHLAHLYDSDEARSADAAAVLAGALSRGEQALGLAGPAALEGLRLALQARGVDVPGALAAGSLLLLPHTDHYTPDGRFDPERVRRAWRERTAAALGGGFAGLVVAADMEWSLLGAPGSQGLVQYEASLGLCFEAPFAAFCQYDLRRFDPEVVRGVLRSHALVAHRGRILRNPTALPPAAAFGAEPAEAEVRRLLTVLHAQAEFEEALAASAARHRLLAENALDVIFRYALQPVPRLEYISPACTAITGYTPEEHYAHPSMEDLLIHPDDRHLVRAEAPPPPEGRTLEVRMIRKDGRVIWTEQRNRTVLDAAGRPAAIEGVVRDVTARKAAEVQLHASERLASLGRLAAGVAHEINNPLAWIGANATFVAESLAEAGDALGPRGPELQQALADLTDGVRRVRAIVRGLSQFSAPRVHRERAPRDVAHEIRAALSMALNELGHRATVRVDVPTNLPPVLAGEAELAQVFLNLLVNAAQALPDRPAGVNQVVLSACAAGGEVVVAVRDNGPGVPETVRPHLFEPFFTTRVEGGGHGLGLSICHGIVEGLGGRIALDCPPGGGTVFEVRLPATPAVAAATPTPPSHRAWAGRQRVLVIDDEPQVARSLARLLAPSYDVTTFTSPREALRRIEAGDRWGAVLCDLMMPELTGPDLVDWLRTGAPDLLPRVVLLTGGAFTERARALLAEGWPALEKPVEADALRAAVAAVLLRAAA